MAEVRFSFKKGFYNLRYKDMKEARRRLMNAFGVSTYQGLRLRMVGEFELTVRQKEAVESIFADYGVTDIWGVDDKQLSSITA